ncbi:hypothetical protein BDZ94DRAFT_1302117 [Collybia nuda]|uniref:WDR59/RTC1-like RING zinc finger domain-containing protein n=1 Tax=Collybia nuda TaxID=64659 RepID=A0A9P6CDJ0_9AGAR|nr:hypothetical protein BDZ94DRAFT_1302117 [Collybia nuda]
MNNLQLTIQTSLDVYSDSRGYGGHGPTRNVRLFRATPSGGGAVSKSEDGVRCAVTGKESLRVIRVSDGTQPYSPGHKSSVGRGGHRIDASRNFWDGSGLKIDSTSTDVAWGHGIFNNKILTSARNGDLIMWDLNKSGISKYERRSKDHIRSIHTMSVSHIVHHYCITGSADGDMRVWDLRDLTRSLMRVHHPTSVRSVVFSPSTWQPLHAVVGLDNGSIYRWDLKMGQRGLLDRLPVAHTASVTTLDWCNLSSGGQSTSGGGSTDGSGNGLGWLVSGGLDRCVKVWDLTSPGNNTRIPNKPKYTLYPSFQVRRVSWRPSFECELAVVSNAEFSTGSNPELLQDNGSDNNPSSVAVGGDAVEIWDVRRSWIPKWSVTGSAAEGGVNDIAFADSDALLAHHSSGTFSQIDLRNCTKPLDAISRTPMSWEVSGSLAFVTASKTKWEVPYDDIAPERRFIAEKLQVKIKALGDERYIPTSQNMGTLTLEDATQEVEIFKQLAMRYVIEGDDRTVICSRNAQIALQAGRNKVAQAWLLLAASLDECMPYLPAAPSPPPPPFHAQSPILPHSVSAPATMSNNYSFPSSGPSPVQKSNPSRGSSLDPHTLPPRSNSVSKSRKMTPASSNASSPRQIPTALPPLTPRRPSFMSGRELIDPELARRTSISLYRRPSISAHSSHSISPGERASGGGSLRHVGEGALDDSDSSSASGSDDDDDSRGARSSDDEVNLRPLTSPGLPPLRNVPTPSPLSRVAGQQQWTEDESERKDGEDDEDGASSPSPRSTDTESTGSNSPRRRPKSNSKASKRFSSRMKTRSRSSTVASLAAPPIRTLPRQDSFSSIRTVTAGEVSFRDHEHENHDHGLKAEETLREVRATHDRHASQAVSELALDPPEVGDVVREEHVNPEKMTDRRIEMVRSDEGRFRELAWGALRGALEGFADEGDVQTCSMLAIIAPKEMRLSRRRINSFLDAYIDLLSRRRLHACAAYLRKYCQVGEISGLTLMETIIYTTCGKCRKPLIRPAGSRDPGTISKGGYSYCKACRMPCVTCAICRLPVRALLFQCSVCSHGGHQACYRDYYEQRPMVDLPSTFVPSIVENTNVPTNAHEEDTSSTTSMLGSTSSLTFDSSIENSPIRIDYPSNLAGHPCAAGCGHFCWATNNSGDDL